MVKISFIIQTILLIVFLFITSNAVMVMSASATTVTLSPSDMDVSIYQRYPDTNFGTDALAVCSYLKSGTQYRNVRGLIYFDLSSIPTGATITSANLYLYSGYGDTVSSIIDIHRVTVPWTEAATWNKKDGSIGWSTPGGDYDPAVIGSVTTKTTPYWANYDVRSSVQSFVDGIPNYGWLLKDYQENSSVSKADGYKSRENADPSLRPYLEVTYSEGAPESIIGVNKTANVTEAGVGDVIGYSIVVNNTGEFNLTNVQAYDDITAHREYIGTLTPGQNYRFNRSYRVTQDDICQLLINNVTVNGTDTNGTLHQSFSLASVEMVPRPNILVQKTANRDFGGVGDLINYTIVVNNTGDVNLTGVRAYDNLTGHLEDIGSLAPGEHFSFNTSYQIVEGDLNRTIFNKVVANGTDPCGSLVENSSIETVDALVLTEVPIRLIVWNSGIEFYNDTVNASALRPSAWDAIQQCGVSYTYSESEWGIFVTSISGVAEPAFYVNGAMSDVGVDSYYVNEGDLLQFVGPNDYASGQSASILYFADIPEIVTPGASFKVHVMEKPANGWSWEPKNSSGAVVHINPDSVTGPNGWTADIVLDETGTYQAYATKPGCLATNCLDGYSRIDALNPAIEVNKTADREIAGVGETVTYTIFVNNTGDVALHSITATDNLTGHVEAVGALAPGESHSFVTTYEVKGTDMGKTLVNNVTVSGTDPVGGVHSAYSIETVDVADTVTMRLMVFDDGNLVFNNEFEVVGTNPTSWDAIQQSGMDYDVTDYGGELGIFIDRLAGVGDYGWGPSFWHDGEFSEWGCSNWHIHEGELDQWIGPNYADGRLASILYLAECPATVGIGQGFRIKVTEMPAYAGVFGGTPEPSEGATVVVGDQSYVTGSDGYTEEIHLDTHGTYCVYATKPDYLATYWLGAATPEEGVSKIQCGAGGPLVCGLPGPGQSPTIKVTMTSNVTKANVGDVIGYTIVVNNTGDVNLDNVVAVDDLTGHVEYIGYLGTPGTFQRESYTFNLTYNVPEADIGKVIVNNVTVSGTSPYDVVVENLSKATVAIAGAGVAEIVVSKTANVTEARIGDVIGYTIVVNNTGDVNLTNVQAFDNLTGHIENVGTLAAGANYSFDTIYLVAESDQDTTIINNVTANGTSPSGALVEGFDTASVEAIAVNMVPVANFTANVTSGDAPLTVQFTDLSTNVPTSWAWDFDNDSTVDSIEQNPSHTYDAAGTYDVNLTASNAAGSDSEVKAAYIVVNESASPVTDFTYTISEGAVTITGYVGPGGNVVIPGTIDGMPVTIIANNAFKDKTTIVSVTIPDSVTSLGDYAFSGCAGLTSVTIGNGVTSIGGRAFRSCTALTSISIGNGVTSIGTYAFQSCTGLTSITIPNSVNSIGANAFNGCTALASAAIGSGVTTIGANAFKGCTALIAINVEADNSVYSSIDGVLYNKAGTSLLIYPMGKAGPFVVPSGVTSIGESAFSGCTALTSVTIPDSVTSIGNSAFSGCTALTSVTIPNSVTSIGDSTFSGCTALTSVTIPNSITSIGNSAFSGCTGLTSVTIPDSVTSIGRYAFSGCTALTSVTIPGTVTNTGDQAFRSCTSLTSVIIGNGVTAIGTYCFMGCTALTSVTIPDTVTSIDRSAFESCTALTSMTIPNSVTSIGITAFKDSGLTSVTIPNSVTSIGDMAFYGCTALTSVTIGSGLTSIGNQAFSSCTALASISVDANNSAYTSIDGVLYNKAMTFLVVYPAGKSGPFVIPSGVTAIGTSSFQGCISLTSVTIPDSVTSIGNQAFSGCTALTSMTIPDSVISIGERAFSGCTALTSMTFEGNAPTLGSNWAKNVPTTMVVYYYQGATGFTNPWNGFTTVMLAAAPVANFTANVTSGDAPLTVQFTDLSTNSPTAWSWDFNNDSVVDSTEQNPGHVYTAVGTYTVNLMASNSAGSDSEVKAAYIVVNESASPASDFTYTSDGSSITITGYVGPGGNVIIPGTIDGLPVTIIGNNAFKSKTAVTTVTIPNSVTSIGNYAFRSCTALTSVAIPDSVTSIGSNAFYGCTALTSVTIGSGVTSISSGMFSGCTALTAINVDANNLNYASADGVLYDKAITTLIFCPLGKAGSLVIPDSVTSIGETAFSGCTALTSVTIPDGVTSIGGGAFWKCTALTSVTIPDSVTSIAYSAFQDCTSLTSVTIGSGVTSIGNSAFLDCSALTSVTIPNSVTSIGNEAFSGCTHLASVTIGNGVTTIGEYAFSRCTSLTSVTIPDSVTSIGQYGFYICTALTSVTIGNGVTTIGEGAFGYCTALTAIDVDASNSAYSSVDGVLYNKAVTTLVQCPFAKASIVIPAGVEIIGKSAFEYSTALTSVTIPNSVTTIGRSAFHDCTNLASVTIPDSVTSIDGEVFSGCSALTSVTIPNNVTTIDSYAFQRCTALTTVTIGSGVTSIDYCAFRDCTALTSMTFEGNAPTVVSDWAKGCTNLVVYYYDGATGFTTPTWQGVPCHPLVSAPVADFSASVTDGIAPLLVQFTDLSTRLPTAWSWDFNNDSVVDSTEQNPAYTYDIEGNYTVSLTVSNDLGSSTETKVDYIAVFLQGRQPVANDKYVAAVEAVPRGIILEASDADEDPLTYEIVENPAHGTLSGTAPDVTYTSDAGYTGDDCFTFRAFDGTYYSNTATVSIIVGTAGEHSPWAAEVVDYKGPLGSSPYDDPNAVLGKPSTRGPGFRIKLVEPAYATYPMGNKLITSLEPGAYITVKFDHPVVNDPNNPYGIDLLVFGNSFFTGGGVSDNSNMDEYTLKGGIFEEPVTVAVSQDNVTWYTYAGGPYADSMFPTHAYRWDSATHSWTDTEMDFTRPVDPSLTVDDFTGLTGAQAIALYDGSGGGTGYDLDVFGLDWIQYVKVQSDHYGEIDAFADVAPQHEGVASIAVNKTANVTEAGVGDVIGYTILVNNTGDVALENVAAYDNLTDHVENIGVLAAGAGYSFNQTYQVTEDDLCKLLVNNVTANGTATSGAKVESFSIETVEIVSHPAIAVSKSANVTEAEVGDVVGYTIFVNNTGDVALDNVTARDNLTGHVEDIGALAAGAGYSFSLSRQVAKGDAGKVLVNNVTANGTDPCGSIVAGFDTAEVLVEKAAVPGVAEAVEYILSCQNPDGGFATTPGGASDYKLTADAAVALAQTGDLGRATKGDMLAYLSAHAPPTTIQNYPGNLGRHVMGIVAAGGDPHNLDGIDYVQMLKDVEPAGQLFADSYIIMGLTAAGESDCQKVQDLIALYLQKQGTAGGWSWMAGGSDVDTTGMVVSALVKAGVDPTSEPIQKALTYLRGIQDVPTGGFSMGSGMAPSPNSNSCGLAIMAINAGGENAADWVTTSGKNPIDFMLTCQQDSGVFWWKPDSAGSFLLEETAFGALAMDGGFMPTVILGGKEEVASIAVNKTANVTEASVGDVIGYSIVVNNTGQVSLTGVAAFDNLTGHVEEIGDLAPGESFSFNQTYQVTEDDFCKHLVNNVTANGTATSGGRVENYSIETVEIVSHPAIAVNKTANVTEADLGDVIGYTIWVNNTGEVGLENVTAFDDLTDHVEAIGTLAPGVGHRFELTYVVSEVDLENGSIINNVTANGTDPCGAVVEGFDTASVEISSVPEYVSMQLMVFDDGELVYNKTVAVSGVNPTSWDAIQQSGVEYEYNTDWGIGVFIDRLAGVGEPQWGPSFWIDGEASEWLCDNWNIHEGELDQWIGPNSASSSATILRLAEFPETIAKGVPFKIKVTEEAVYYGTPAPTEGATVTVGGQSYVTGADGYTGEIVLDTDANYCVYATKPDCLATYWLGAISPADGVDKIQCGAGGSLICGLPEPDQNPRLDVTKTANVTEADAGDVIGYTIVVNNTGDVNLDNVVAVDDLTGHVENIGYLGTPGTFQRESYTFNVTYNVTEGDIGKAIVNNVTVSGSSPYGVVVENFSTATVTTAGATVAGIDVSKTANVTEAGSGDIIGYSIVVNNTGQVNLTNVTAYDNLTAHLESIGDLAPGENFSFNQTYRVTGSDIGRVIVNNVTANGTDPSGLLVEGFDTAAVGTLLEPYAIYLDKTVSPAAALQSMEANFTINVTNTGTLPLAQITLVDQLPEGLSYVSDDHSGTSAGDNVTWDLSLASGESKSIHLKVRIDGDAPSGVVTNLVNATGDATDEDSCAFGIGIQGMIDIASPGDVIEIPSGTYYERLNVNKQLTLRGVDTGNGMPVIDAGGSGNAITLSANGCTIEGVMVTNSQYGIYLVSSSNNTVTGNTVTSTVNGIYLYSSSSDNVISDNALRENSQRGIYLSNSCNNNEISGNAITSGTYGIEMLTTCSNNEITGNTISSTGFYGIRIHKSPSNFIEDNEISDSQYGMYLSSDSIVVSGNTIEGCSNSGIYISGSGDIIFLNDFTNNVLDAKIGSGSGNRWNSTEELDYTYNGPQRSFLGNHWSNYAGVDADGDGIGDTPHLVASGKPDTDYYPLSIWSAPHLEVNKTANVTEFGLDDQIEYAIFVNNTGMSQIDNIVAVDDLTGHVENIGSLAPGQGRYFTTLYTATIDDIGFDLVNTVTANGTDSEGRAVEFFGSSTLTPKERASIEVVKTASPTGGLGPVDGQGPTEITFVIKVTNAGDQVLSPITLTDQIPAGLEYVSDDHGGVHDNGNVTWVIPTLNASESASIELVALIGAAAEPGLLTNLVDVIGTPPLGKDATGSTTCNILVGIQPAIAAAKAGDTILIPSGTYVESVIVNKRLTLQGIDTGAGKPVITAPGLSAIELMSVSGCTVEGLEIASSYTGIEIRNVGSHTIRDCDVHDTSNYGIYVSSSTNNLISDNQIHNNAARGLMFLTNAGGNTVIKNSIFENNVGIYLYKEAPNNVIYLNDVRDNDDNFYGRSTSTTSLNTWNSPFPLSYEYGGVTRTSLLGNRWSDYTGVDANGDGIGDTPYLLSTSWQDMDYYPLFGGANESLKIEVNKTADRKTAMPGDVIGYTVWVNNTGNVILEDVSAYDNLTGHLEDIGTLAPGECHSFETSYLVNETDLCRPIVNNVTANGTASGTLVSNFSIETVETDFVAVIDVNKTANVTKATTGSVIGYEIWVNNTGNVNLTGVLAYDNLTGHLEDIGDLVGGESYRFNLTYTVTESDLNTTLVNNVTANGTDPCGSLVEGFDTATVKALLFELVPVQLMVWDNGTLVFNETFDVNGFDSTAWDAIVQSGVNYTYSESEWGIFVTSISEVTEPAFYVNGEMSAVGVDGYIVNAGDLLQFVGPNDYASGQSAAILYLAEVPEFVNPDETFRIKVMEKPANGFSWPERNSSGAVVHINPEYPTGDDGWTGDISINGSADKVYANKTSCLASFWLDGYSQILVQSPFLEVNKTANLTEAKVGDVIGYTVEVNNTGDVALANVTARDNLTGHIEAIGTLAPGASYVFDTTYRIVKKEELNKTLVNLVTVNGTDAVGGLVAGFDTASVKSTDTSLPGVAGAVEYILSCQNPDGGFANAPGGASSLSLAADAAVALAQTGDLDRATRGDLLGYLISNAPDSSISSGNLGRYVMGLVAAGGDPSDVNGVDYVQRLKEAAPLNQFFSDSYILMGLAAAGEANSAEAQALITTFINGQAGNGGWSWAPGGSDVDTTGMVVSALVKAGISPTSDTIQDALGYLRGIQDVPTGGFSMGSGMAPSPNSNSCGLAIMAINAGGENALDWMTTSGKNPIDFMLTCQQPSGVIWWTPTSAGGMLLEGTAYGALGMDGGFMPPVICDHPEQPEIMVNKTANLSEAEVGDVIGYTIWVNNTGDVALTNVMAFDNLTGHLENIGALAAGENYRFNTTYQVAESDRNTTIINNVTANGTSPSGAPVESFDLETVDVVTKVPPGVAKAIEYVLSCQNADGGFGNGVGVASSHRDTSEAVMALVLTGDLDRATKGDVLGYLAANPSSTTLPNYAGNLGRYVMGVVAAGGNPHDLGGINYVELLKAEARKGNNSNFFSHALVPLGLAAAGEPDCVEAQQDIAFLKERQGAAGNWVGVDATGLVICSMIACGEDPSSEPVQKALTWLASVQKDDGGFPADPGGASNSNSENLAIMAISATGGDPSTWVKNGLTPIDHLLSCQQDSGQIWWKPNDAGYFPMQSTAWGAIALWGGWLPTATYEVPVVHPAIEVNKTANVTEAGIGDVIGYAILVNNTGDVNLTSVLAYDNLTGHLENIGDLAPGESFSFNTAYRVTGDDLCRLLVNNVTANGTSPSGGKVENFSIETVEIISQPAISVSKTANVTEAEVGDVVGYTIVVNNTGDVALANVTAYDNLTGHLEEIGALAPGESRVFNTSYQIAGSDLNKTIVNLVVANGTDPCGVLVEDNDIASVEAVAVNVVPVELLVWNNGTLVFNNTFDVSGVDPTAWDAIQQSGVAYTYTEYGWGIFVETISGVNEPAFYVNGDSSTVGVSGYRVSDGDLLQFVGPNDWASGQSASILYLAEVPEVVNAGENFKVKVMEKAADGFSWDPRPSSGATVHVDGAEHLTGSDGWTGEISIDHDVDAYATKDNCLASCWLDGYAHIQVQRPEIVVNKIANVTKASAEDVIGYTIWVNNTGNVNLENVAAYDNLTDRFEPIGHLAPGESYRFSTIYQVTETDLCNPIVNNVTANGTDTKGIVVTNFSIEVVETVRHSAIEVNKTANVTKALVGDVIGYTIWVNNTGDVSLDNVVARDDLTGRVEPIGHLAPGESYRFSTIYTVTESDVNTTIVNNASANGTDPCGTFFENFDTADVEAFAKTFDFGDAADPTYPTLLASNGARHVIDGVTYLGSSIDSEDDGQPSPDALGDDNDGNDDEDGVVFARDLVPGGIGSVETTATTPGKLDAWIDFNRDGDWADGGEQIFAGEDLPAGTSYHSFAVPMGAVADDSLRPTFARFRFSTAGGLSFTGLAPNGEVEDHGVAILNDSDGDGATDIAEGRYKSQPPDRDGDGIPDYEDYDPSGYFYDETTGEIIPGGKIDVTGPGQVTIVEDGSSGYYEFWTDGTPGTYFMLLTFPPGYGPSAACPHQPGSFAPTGSDPIYLGSGEFGNTGYIQPFDCQNNNYYISFDLEPGDPFVMTNNIPLSNQTATGILSVTKTADKSEVKRCGDVTYTIRVNNTWGVPLQNVVVRDVFNKPVEFVSASPTPEAEGIWRFPEVGVDGVTISLKVKVPEAQDFEFGMDQRVTGEGFVSGANDYSTSLESYTINNCVYVTSEETGDTVYSDCESVTVLADAGTELSTREHGSGTYESEDLVKMRTENKSISMEKDMAAAYSSTTLGLYNNRTVNFSSRWTEEARAKNRLTGASMSESYRHATHIDRESRMSLDDTESSMAVNSEFDGTGHIGFFKMPSSDSDSQTKPIIEIREDYTGSFKVVENVDEHGSGVSFNKSATGGGLVVGDKRVGGGSQRSYESGTGTYDSEEIIETYTNYIAKDIGLNHAPMNQSLTDNVSVNASLRWKEGMYSKVPGTSYIGEEYTGIEYLDKETISKGLNEMDTNASFEGHARYRTIFAIGNEMEPSIDLDEQYTGDYSIERHILLSGAAKYDRPHLNVTKTLDEIVEKEDECDEESCSNAKYIATYTITIENDGNAALGPIYVKDTFPPGAVYEGSSLRPSELGECCYANWTLTHLSIGDVVTITVELDVTKYYPYELVNRVEVCGGQDGEQVCAANYSALELNWLTCCLNETVSVTKTGDVDPVNQTVVWYRIDITNHDDVTRVATVTDHLPAGMTLRDSMVPFASYDGSIITWNLIEIDPLETVTIPYRAEAQHAGRFVNIVEVDPRSVDGPVVQPVYTNAVVDVGEPAECQSTSCEPWSPPNWDFDYVGSSAPGLTCEDIDLGD